MKIQTALGASLTVLLGVINTASASHPDVFHVERDGVVFSCHPKSKPKLCPVLIGTYTDILVTLDRVNCLEGLKAESATEADVRNCFLVPRLKSFFDDLQLYDVPFSCITKNIRDCAAYVENCSSYSCGSLGDFIKELNDRGLSHLFDREKGAEACKSLAY